MDAGMSMDTLRAAIFLAITIGAPLLLVGLVVGFVVSVFQAVTQIQDQTVSTVPKLIAILLAAVIFLPWIADRMVSYTQSTYEQIPELIQP